MQTKIEIKDRRTALIELSKATLVVIGAAVGCNAVASSQNQDLQKKYQAYLDEKTETGGFVVTNTAPGVKQVELLPSGKVSRSGPDNVFVLSDKEDARNETLGAALKQIGDQCEIVGTTAVTEPSGWGSATSGLIVQVRNCK